MTGIKLTAKEPFTQNVITKDLDDWLEPKITNAPSVDFRGFYLNGVSLENRYAGFDEDRSWQVSLSTIQNNGTACFRSNGEPIDACLKGCRPANNRFHAIKSAGQISIERTATTLKIGDTTFYASSFKNNFLPYSIVVVFCGGGGDGGDGGVYGGKGGGGGGSACVLLNFLESSRFSLYVGNRNEESFLQSPFYSKTVYAKAGGNGTNGTAGAGGSVDYSKIGGGMTIIGYASGGDGGENANYGHGVSLNARLSSDISLSLTSSGGSGCAGFFWNGGGGGGGSALGDGGAGGEATESGFQGGLGGGGGAGCNGVGVIFAGAPGKNGGAFFYA